MPPKTADLGFTVVSPKSCSFWLVSHFHIRQKPEIIFKWINPKISKNDHFCVLSMETDTTEKSVSFSFVVFFENGRLPALQVKTL